MNLKNDVPAPFAGNRELNRREIERRAVTLASRPTSLVVTLSTRCNIRCRMCEEHAIPWEIPPRAVDEIVELMPYLEQVIWQGGETLLLDYFTGTLLEEARKHPRLHQSVVTNGLPIDETLAGKLVGENTEIIFSIDGTTRESYEAIRRGADFGTLVRNLRTVVGLRKERNPRNMSLRMHAVVMRSNYRELERFVEFAREHGFDALHLMPIWGNIDGDENIFHHRDAAALRYLEDHMGNAERKARDYRLDLLSSLPVPRHQPPGEEPRPRRERPGRRRNELWCHMPWKRMVINPAGNVCPACHCTGMIGNVTEKSLAELWNGGPMREYRAKIAGGKIEGLCSEACIQGSVAPELRGLV